MRTNGFRAGVEVVATKLGIILLFLLFLSSFFFPCTYFSPRRGLPRKLKFGGWPYLTLTRRFWGKYINKFKNKGTNSESGPVIDLEHGYRDEGGSGLNV